MKYRKILKGIFKPLVVVVAALYFVIDGLVLAALRPTALKANSPPQAVSIHQTVD
jgi:hypothetical protein